jgi:sterol desaturase/sphingolipid hydroxylase (fatty acid hydroxylase superfamily)
MRMSKLGYFAEFLVFPVFFVVLTALAFTGSHPRIPVWLAAVLLGVLFWIPIEYLLHRFVFHHMPIIAVMHDRHHRDPTALIGTPAWMSLFTGVVAALLPLWIVVGFGLATAVAIGLLCGYLWYVLVHYAIHHWPARRDTYLYRAKLRHTWHHRSHETNFGVTNDLCDRIFATISKPPSKRGQPQRLAEQPSRPDCNH